MITGATCLTHLCGDNPETDVPVHFWYRLFLWLDTIPVEQATDRERLIYNENHLMGIQLHEGTVRYAFGHMPQTWSWVDSLVDF